MFVRSRFSPWNTDIALGAAEKKISLPETLRENTLKKKHLRVATFQNTMCLRVIDNHQCPPMRDAAGDIWLGLGVVCPFAGTPFDSTMAARPGARWAARQLSREASWWLAKTA